MAKSWEEVVASPEYQKATPQQRANAKAAYDAKYGQQAAAPAPTPAAPAPAQQDDSLTHNIAQGASNFLKGAGAGVAQGVVSGATGLGGIVGQALQDTETMKEEGKATTAYTDRINKTAQQSLQNTINQGGTMGQAGAMVGRTGADIGAMVLAPEVAIPMLAAREMGTAFSEQNPENHNIGNAALVGAANYLANRILPGAGGEAASGLVGSALNIGRKAAEGAWAGAKGGAVVGAANAINQNGDVLEGAIQGAMEGGAFGGTIGGTHAAIGEATKVVTPKLAEIGAAPVKMDVDNQAARDAIAGSELLANRNIPLTDARLAGNEHAMAAFGKTVDDVNASRSASRAKTLDATIPLVGKEAPVGNLGNFKEQVEKGGRQLFNDMNTSLGSVSDSTSKILSEVSQLKATADAAGRGTDYAAELAPLQKFNSDFTKYKNEMARADQVDSSRPELLEKMAQDAQDSFNALPDPVKAEIQQNFIPVEGLGNSMDFVAHAKVYGNAMSQLKAMHPTFRSSTTNPTGGSEIGVGKPTSLVDLAGTALRSFKAGSARKAFLAEQEAAKSQTMGLAAGMRRAEDNLAASRPSAENPPQEQVDDIGLQTSTGESAAQQAEAAPKEEQTQKVMPDQIVTRSPKKPVVETPVEAPVEAPAPSPDQTIVRQPKAPEVTPEAPVEPPAPVEEAPAPTPAQPDMGMAKQPTKPAPAPEPEVAPVEPAPAPQPDMGLAATPRRPEIQPEVAPEPAPETPTEAPEPAPEAPKPQPDMGMAKEPKKAEKAAEEAPKQSTVDIKQAKASEYIHKAAQERKLNSIKDSFSDEKIADKVTLDNMDDKDFIQHLRREDNAANVEKSRHIAETALKQRNAREEKTDELNRNELDRWAKESKIPSEYVNQAISDAGLNNAKILGVNAIKTRTLKLYNKDTAPKSYPEAAKEEAAKATFKDQQSTLHDEVMGMDKEVQSEVLKALRTDARFRASEQDNKTLSDSEMRDIRVKLYNTEQRIQQKLGNEKAAQEAADKVAAEKAKVEKATAEKAATEAQKAKDAEEAARIAKIQQTQDQIQKVQDQIEKTLKDVPEDVRKDFTNSYMDRHFGVTETPMTDLQLQRAISKAGEAADKHKATHEKMNTVEKELALHHGETNEKLDAALKELEALKETIGKTGKEAMREGMKDVSAEVISKAEHALRHFGTDGAEGVQAVQKAIDTLSTIYGKDTVAAQPMKNFARVAEKAAKYREDYPNNPEMWVTQEDFDSLAHAGVASGQGLKQKMANAVIGKQYDQINPLTESERAARAKRLDKGEELKAMDLTKSGQAREKELKGALTEGTKKSDERKVTIKNAPKKETPHQMEMRREKFVSDATKVVHTELHELRQSIPKLISGMNADQISDLIKVAGRKKGSATKAGNLVAARGWSSINSILNDARKAMKKGS